MKKILSLLALAALTIGLLGSCKKEDPKVSVTGVSLDKTELTITVGDADVKLTATVAPDNATDKTVNWASDKAEVATVDNQGSVHAVAPGEAIITVTTTDGGKKATCAVTVKAAKVPVTGVTLDRTTLEITIGDPDVKLVATVTPDDATDKTVNWASDKTDFATVDKDGNVHAVAPGEAIITVTTTDGGKTATCVVKVKAAVVPVSSVALDKTELTLTVGDPDVKLVATVTPDNATDKTVNWASDKAEVATVDDQGNVHAVTAGTANITVTTTDGGKTATCTVTVKAGLPTDAPLPGEFSVSGTKKVRFSKGNLVATINASGAPTAWKFAANQYDCLGKGGANETIGKTAGDIDLFGWSTASTTYGISTSTNNSDYSGDFVDWGKIGDGNTWRTLTKDEWTYLINTRIVNGGTGAGKSYSLIIYGGMMGVVLYPDDYTGSVLSGTVDSLPEGVVFLPAAGDRVSTVSFVGDRGTYWSSTASGSMAYGVAFNIFSSHVGESISNRYAGLSVRLITDVK